MVGFVINTLPVRMKLNASEPVMDWLARVQNEQAEAHQYQHTPLIDIQSWSEVHRGAPLFESLVVFENYISDAFERRYGEHFRMDSVRLDEIGTIEKLHYPLAVIVVPGDELLIRLRYDTHRFSEDAAERITTTLVSLLTDLIREPE